MLAIDIRVNGKRIVPMVEALNNYKTVIYLKVNLEKDLERVKVN